MPNLNSGAKATHGHWLHPGMPSGASTVSTATLSFRGGLRGPLCPSRRAALRPRMGAGCIRGCRQVPTPFLRRLSAFAEGCGARCVFADCVFLDLRERARGAGHGALSRILHSPLSVSRGARARGHGPSEIAVRREHVAVYGAREIIGGENLTRQGSHRASGAPAGCPQPWRHPRESRGCCRRGAAQQRGQSH